MVVRRTVAAIVTLFVASVLIFAAVNVLPGNAAYVVLGRTANPHLVKQIEATLHLDQPLVNRYLTWAGNVLSGHLGNSTIAVAEEDPQSSVASIIREPLVNSLILAVITVLLFIPLALALGAYTGIRAGKAADHALSTTSLIVGAMPEFLIATLLIAVFFVGFNLLPPVSLVPPGQSPLDHPDILVLPVLTLLLVSLAYTSRQVRAMMIEVLRQDYVAMARLNGFTESRVLVKYALRNALAPSVQTIAQTTQYLLGGIIIVESVFDYNGIGNLLVHSVEERDVQLVSVIAFLIAAAYIAINLVADLVVVFLVPKLRTQAR
jgi:peptide/nickel transport system permease protein